MLRLNEIKQRLNANKARFEKKYGVGRFGIFGSYARNEENASSDLDILVELNQPIGLSFIDLADELEALMQMKVDLVSRKGIKPKYFQAIEQDIQYV
jgi:uncharacterized protein